MDRNGQNITRCNKDPIPEIVMNTRTETVPCTYMCRTCSYLIGNKGTHVINGNSRPGTKANPGEAELTSETLTFIRENVDVSVGFVRLRNSQGTGFRVGQKLFMTAYHVIADEIENMLEDVLHFLDIDSEEAVNDLVVKLGVKTEKDSKESIDMVVRRVVNMFVEECATDIGLLLQRLESLTDTVYIIKRWTDNWKKNCKVDFLKHGQFTIDWRILFGDKDRDIVIVRLLESQKGQTFPRSMLLDENYRQHGDIQIIRYIHGNPSKVIMDQRTIVFKNDAEAERRVQEAVGWWKEKYPQYEESFFKRQYAECCKSVNEETGRVTLRASESFIAGSSGSPIVYLFNETGQPVVSMIYQRGYPGFYYDAQRMPCDDFLAPFKDIQVDCKCFCEGGTTMKKIAILLNRYGKSDLKDEIFRQPVESMSMTENGSDSGRQITDAMALNVEKWEEIDKNCYITKAMEIGRKRMCNEEENFLSIAGVPGSGKTTTMWNIAIYLKRVLGFHLYPISRPKEFELYLDRNKKQAFLFDDIIGEYIVDQKLLDAWRKQNDKVKNCLSKNTKILLTLRIQLREDELLKGKIYLFNDKSHSIDLGEAQFRLSENEMANMLKHYLKVNHIDEIEGLTQNFRPWWVKDHVDIFPLLCKVFSQNPAVRNKPRDFFAQPFELMTDIFTQIKTQNKCQFCGLVLCAAVDLNDEYFSRLCEQDLDPNNVQLRNIIMESLEVETQELKRVRSALESLDGVYITRFGNAFKFSHSLFQDIVTYLYNDSPFVLKYGTKRFIHDRVRIHERLAADNEYVLVYDSDRDIQRLVNRFIQELGCGTRNGAEFIVNYPCIDDGRLIACLKRQLFDNKFVTQDMINELCERCMDTLMMYASEDVKSSAFTDVTKWRPYRLLPMVLQEAEKYNFQVHAMTVINGCLYLNCPLLAKYLLQQNINININELDEENRCVLHYAVINLDLTRYLLNLPNLTCLNQPDSKHKTPYSYVLQNQRPVLGSDWVFPCEIPNKEQMIHLYQEKEATVCDDEEECTIQ